MSYKPRLLHVPRDPVATGDHHTRPAECRLLDGRCGRTAITSDTFATITFVALCEVDSTHTGDSMAENSMHSAQGGSGQSEFNPWCSNTVTHPFVNNSQAEKNTIQYLVNDDGKS
jgi:hypothetical protein